jgi:hypothetical protein
MKLTLPIQICNRLPFVPVAAAARASLACFVAFHWIAMPPANAQESAEAPDGLHYYFPPKLSKAPQLIEADVCVYGATPGGVTAAMQASRMGKKAVLLELGRHVGGMTAGGLSDTDGGDKSITGGIADEFYARLKRRAGFRPSAAEEAFRGMLAESGVTVSFERAIRAVSKEGNRIVELSIENGDRVRAKEFIDATYEGDLMAMAGVSYTIGREGNAKYGEKINGVIFGPKDNFDKPVDPYVHPGDPASGLLPGITGEPTGEIGAGDKRIQAYNFRMWLVPAKLSLPWPKPANYEPARYELLLRYIEAGNHYIAIHAGDNNNHHFFNGAFSTDDIGMNYAWPEADYPTREKIFQEHVSYQKGLMYFLANDSRVPAEIREKIGRFGLPKDDFTDCGGWPFQLYVREARRMVSDYVMTEHNGLGEVVAEDGIALASYQMDSHNTARVVLDGKVSNEGQTYEKVPRPLPLAYRAIVPRESECANLSVVFCVSASHTGLSTLRMEPVLMITGQSAATAACMAIDAGCSMQKLDYHKLRTQLLAEGQILTPPPVQPKVESTPRLKLTGIVVDDDAAQFTGAWVRSALLPPLVGDAYHHDGNSDQGHKSARFTPDLPAAGRYEVRLIYVANGNRATNVPVTVVSADGEKTVSVNEQESALAGGVPRTLGVFRFDAGKKGAVIISNANADGYVTIDAVQFVPVGGQ